MPESNESYWSSRSEDGETPRQRQRIEFSSFDSHNFNNTIKALRSARAKCCGIQCLSKQNEMELKTHTRLMDQIFFLDPPNLRTQTLRLFSVACYISQVNNRSHHCEFRLPAFKNKMCRDVWCKMLNISVTTHKEWRCLAILKRDVLPPHPAAPEGSETSLTVSWPPQRTGVVARGSPRSPVAISHTAMRRVVAFAKAYHGASYRIITPNSAGI